VEVRYFSSLPVPPPGKGAARATLPGEALGEEPHGDAAMPVGTWIARLEAPSVSLIATVLEGSDDKTLNRAAGHIEETALPGQPGNLAIAAHRDTIFRPVRNLHVGDALAVTTADRVYRYRVTNTRIVLPEHVGVLASTDHPTLTLVTCYPFTFIGHAPQRFIVTADLVGEEARSRDSGGPGGVGWVR